MHDLLYSISKCWQGLRGVKDKALVWEDETHMNNVSLYNNFKCNESDSLPVKTTPEV